jgi:hypothetical protein
MDEALFFCATCGDKVGGHHNKAHKIVSLNEDRLRFHHSYNPDKVFLAGKIMEGIAIISHQCLTQHMGLATVRNN